MVFRIVICGESQCLLFAEACLVADYLDQNLPSFCYESIEKPVIEWPSFLCKINVRNKWHHTSSPLIWKEVLLKGSKPYYIGGTSEFLEYCHSYYNFDVFLSPKNFSNLAKNFSQYRKKVRQDVDNPIKPKTSPDNIPLVPQKQDYTVCIYGAAYPLAMHLISGLLEMTLNNKYVSKIYIYDDDCSPSFLEYVENECSFIASVQPTRVVKYVDKIGSALTHSDILIILHHVPFKESMSIGEWLFLNSELMQKLAMMINASASRKTYILFGNLGPACYNATVLKNLITSAHFNIVCVSSGVGLDTLSSVAEIAEVPIRNINCPPVWGFVGINHLVDISTTLHTYNSFYPYNRYTRVKNSTLNIGSVTPEMRSLQYLMHFDQTLWSKVAEKKAKMPTDQLHLFKSVAILNVVRLWLFDPDPKIVVNLGIKCNGSFGLTFKGMFSQPCQIRDGKWVPAKNYMLPKDPFVSIYYLDDIANRIMKFTRAELPQIIPFYSCGCKPKIRKVKGVWFPREKSKKENEN